MTKFEGKLFQKNKHKGYSSWIVLIDIYMKFIEDIVKQCRHKIVLQSSKGNYSKSVNARVMVLALCTSSNVD